MRSPRAKRRSHQGAFACPFFRACALSRCVALAGTEALFSLLGERAVYGVTDATLLTGCASPPVEPPDGPQACFCKATLLVTFDGLARCMLFNGGSLTRIPDGAGVVRPSIDMTRVVISVIALLLSQSLIALVSSLAGYFQRLFRFGQHCSGC